MDSIKLEKLITENMKTIFGFALTRVGNVPEAEELASDIFYEIVRSVGNLRDEERFYGFMWKIAENTYMTYLRKKSRNARRVAELDEKNIADGSDSVLNEIVRQEDLNLLRRELSLLSRQYRDATVLYYIEGHSCSEVAKKLNISTEMVKYYLFRARKIIREGMNMERLYGEKSYMPSDFSIDFWGTKGGDDREYDEFNDRKIKGNILLAAHYSPVTIQEISIELGVAIPYLEDEIKMLLARQYLVCKNEKYLTNIPIFTRDCTNAINEKLKEHVETAAERFMAVSDRFSSRFGDRFNGENLMRWQKVIMSICFSLADEASGFPLSDLPDDGPYSLVNGGGGRGVVWGRNISMEDAMNSGSVRGVYCGETSADGRGTVYAINFSQIIDSQWYQGEVDPVVCTAVGCFEYLPDEWKKMMEDNGYAKDGRPNFPVWSAEEWEDMKTLLKECTDIVTELNRKTAEVASAVTADLSPAHIRKTAEFVGALAYRFRSIEKLVDTLYEKNWLKAVGDKDKPALCVVKN